MAVFTRSLLKIFLGPEPEKGRMTQRTATGMLEAWVSIVVNLVLAIVKLFIGILVNSLSVMADAVHTLSDVATSFVVLFGFKIAGKPADKEHPFGHGRVEYVTTLIIAVMLGVVGFEFIKSAIGRLTHPVPIEANLGIMLIIAATLLVKLWLGAFSFDLGVMIDSSTLKADAWHHRTDAISSAMVLVALWTAQTYPAADGIGGILIGLYLIYTGFDLARDVIDPLLGEPPTREYLAKIRAICNEHEHVLNAHDFTVHNYGEFKFIALHAEVSNEHSAEVAHDIAETVADTLKNRLGAYATVHIDPVDVSSAAVAKVRDYLGELMEVSESFADFHDLRVVDTPEHHVILFDVDPIDGLTARQTDDLEKWIVRKLKDKYPDSEIQMVITPPHMYR